MTKSKIQDMHLKFEMVQQQQEPYFQTEKTILDAIWAATDNAWHWSFEHRNTIEKAIEEQFNATGKLIGDLQQQQLKVMLDQAQQSVSHYEDSIQKYKERQEAKAAFGFFKCIVKFCVALVAEEED